MKSFDLNNLKDSIACLFWAVASGHEKKVERKEIFTMKIAVNSLLSLLDVGTSFCYWLLGRDLLEEEVKCIQELFIKVKNPEDELILINELKCLSPGKDLLLICNTKNYNLVQWCILNNYTQALNILLEYGCNPTRTGLSGFDLPLALACCLNRMDMIQILLDYGANKSETTILSSTTLQYLSQQTNKEYYLKLIDLLKNRNSINSVNIALKFDDLAMFNLLMGETIHSLLISDSSTSSSSSFAHMIQTNNDSNIKISETDSDLFRDKLKIENYVERQISIDAEDSVEQQQQQQQQQQHIIPNDDLSDYAEHGHFFYLCDTVDGESPAVNQYDGIQTLSEKCNQVERIHEEETCAPVATTDGGYYTVDESSVQIKSQPLITTINRKKLLEIHMEENIQNLCITQTEQFHHHKKQNEVIHRTKSQQQLTKFSYNNRTMHRRSLPNNVYYHIIDQPSKHFRSTSSSLLSNISNPTKHTAYLLRLLHQMIEHEAETILEYFLKKHCDEFNNHFYTATKSSDIQLQTYELLSNIKSDKIYNVLLSSNCAYFDQVTTSLCDRENNTLVHSLLGQNPLKYQPTEMIKMVERYMTYGLKEFINRPNLSNYCMMQVLLCNEHFLKMIFFPRSPQSSSNNLRINTETMTTLLPIYDLEIVEKWRNSYLILLEILIKHGARIDISAGSYRNSLDCLLSTLLDLAKRLTSIITTTFDMKYLKHLIIILISSLNQTKNRLISFKYNIERFIQLLFFIHINNDDLSDILSIIHLLLQYEYQPLRLNKNTLTHLFKLWITNPNFLCSSLMGKDLFMQQFLKIIIRRLSLSNENTLLLPSSPTTNLPNKSSLILNENDLCLQNLFFILLNLLSIHQTCLQIHSIYQLILIFINHTTYNIINNDQLQLPIVYLCLQIKIIHSCLLIPFIDLFLMLHSSTMINKTKDMLLQIPLKRLSIDLYKYFLSNEKSKKSVYSLRSLSSRYLYQHLQKPFIDSVNRLPIGDALKERLIHFHDI
ncbi:unnamed protein product [Rotaria sordida]|uniref:Ankyrin repeat protein n=1 Tax=Rotaria sordida TaxID=392033 RepID=A0A814WG53_9BILA|nr:unnamed protein product [Rotaria sordida]CAF1481976.1 unnamed protein product [Rotaria sordida]